jgi:hypothetical protein
VLTLLLLVLASRLCPLEQLAAVEAYENDVRQRDMHFDENYGISDDALIAQIDANPSMWR